MRDSVVAARDIQRRRFAGTATRQNGHMTHRQIRSLPSVGNNRQRLLTRSSLPGARSVCAERS